MKMRRATAGWLGVVGALTAPLVVVALKPQDQKPKPPYVAFVLKSAM